MDVTVVIPHYGDPAPTRALVQSLAQQCGTHAEIVVSDDHSPTPFPLIDEARVIHRPTNGGFGANCNTGASIARGRYLLFLNSDVVVSPHFLTDLLAAAQPYQPCVAGPALVDDDASPATTARAFPTPSSATAAWLTPLARWRDTRWWHRAVGHDVDALTTPTPSATGWLVGAALLIPRSDFEAVGGFDERFFMNSEEIDLQRRLRERGLPSIYLPAVQAHHVGGASTAPEFRRRWLSDAQFTYAAKWGGSARLRGALTAATAVNFGWNVARRLCGRPIHPMETARHELHLICAGALAPERTRG